MNKNEVTGFQAELARRLEKNMSAQTLHNVISALVLEQIKTRWDASRAAHDKTRKCSYLSMEFLVGRAVFNNLLCLGLTETVERALNEAGTSLRTLEDIEDQALGNGGLGRLAACFLDSAATLNLPLDGYGIRYKYGLFKQSFKDGFQCEEADDWSRFGDPWGVRRDDETVLVSYADQRVKAVPYDYPVIGFGTDNIGTLRLYQSEPVNAFDFQLFNDQKYDLASAEERRAADISRVLYPNDDTDEGKILRLKQEYFFSAATVADLIRRHKQQFGTLESFAQYNAIQLNDTHPVIAIAELIRVLTADENYSFEQAYQTARETFAYTNHTVMPEALEKWSCDLMRQILPEIYAVILQLNERFITELYRRKVLKADVDKMKLIRGGMVHMANIASFVGGFINGVAAVHTQILKDSCLKEWYAVSPEKFQNKTNGITQRRWLALCNPELSALLTELLGTDAWITDLSLLRKLTRFADDAAVLERFAQIKTQKKQQLAAYIAQHEGVTLNVNAAFFIQIKRLHEYKRQLMNALSILYLYFGIKDGSIVGFTPAVFIFGAKSAPGYARAKGIIKLINEVGKLVNADPSTKDLLQVVFVSNYCVSYAEKLVAAADVSEQISTAGTEASGTGNMKLMLNGAVTLGTLDGANIEIVEEAGAENNYIFGARVEEIDALMDDYDPREIVEADPAIKRVVSALIDGTLSDGGTDIFRELYFSLLEGASWHVPDHYYVLGDLNAYVAAKLRANSAYNNRLEFARKCWLNICGAGKFSSDRTIAEYAADIWNIAPTV
ncbi:MAG: glycogen/starch/alpha-glucan phosphorylase [Oscillospiraceae bacterium]